MTRSRLIVAEGIIVATMIALLSYITVVQAQPAPVTFAWMNPTGCENGIDCLVFNRFELGCGAVPGDRSGSVRQWIDDSTTTRTFTDFATGSDTYCALRVDCIGTPAIGCSFSAWSNEVSFILPTPTTPGPPTGLTVTVGAGF